jgi:XisH protein
MARDLIHQSCRAALEKEGWKITHDPFILKPGGVRLEMDLAAEQVFAAERGLEQIVVEIKSFIGQSKLNDFYEAKGQYDLYKRGLKWSKIDRKLYLAIEQPIFESFFQKPLIAEVLIEDKVSLFIFDAETQTAIQWIEN